jgi:L,D-peptidoglycan transpeptidase YkuD (ErfK/YbiS/YcfS/YnhG family)
VCVDDARSPHYSRIVTAEAAGEGTSGEKMWEIDVYKRGVVVEYPTERASRAGSCIFVHIWAAPGQGTSGCVAAVEGDVEALQEIAEAGEAMIAVVPGGARERLAACLPARSR